MSVDRELGRIAEHQHGLVTREQIRTAGLSPDGLRHRRAVGRLASVQPGTYKLTGAPTTYSQLLEAACLAAGPGAVASHRSAAHLWGLLGEPTDVIEITVPRHRNPRLRDVVVHRSGDLTPDHTAVRNGTPVTNPLRVMVDLGAVLGCRQVEDALDRGLAARLFTVAGVEWMLAAVGGRGRSGAGVIRRVLDRRALGADPPDGMLEPRMARLLRDRDLPAAEFQHAVRRPGGRLVARVDFAYPEHRLAIEVDGYAYHCTPVQQQLDLVRQNALVADGWTVLRYTWSDVVRSPARVAAEIRAVLGT